MKSNSVNTYSFVMIIKFLQYHVPQFQVPNQCLQGGPLKTRQGSNALVDVTILVTVLRDPYCRTIHLVVLHSSTVKAFTFMRG